MSVVLSSADMQTELRPLKSNPVCRGCSTRWWVLSLRPGRERRTGGHRCLFLLEAFYCANRRCI